MKYLLKILARLPKVGDFQIARRLLHYSWISGSCHLLLLCRSGVGSSVEQSGTLCWIQYLATCSIITTISESVFLISYKYLSWANTIPEPLKEEKQLQEIFWVDNWGNLNTEWALDYIGTIFNMIMIPWL